MWKQPKVHVAPSLDKRYMLFVPIAYAYIVGVVFLVLWQLMSFNTFAEYVASYFNVQLNNFSLTFAIILLVVEVFSLPFLFRMRLSTLARLCSAACALLVPTVWSAVMLAMQPTNLMLLATASAFIIWGAITFWVLGGTKALSPKAS